MWGLRGSSVQGRRFAGENEEDFHENNQEYDQDSNHNLFVNFIMGIYFKAWFKKQGKTVPLQAWSGPGGSRKLRFPDFMTTAQDGGKIVSLTHRPPLPPGNIPGTHFW